MDDLRPGCGGLRGEPAAADAVHQAVGDAVVDPGMGPVVSARDIGESGAWAGELRNGLRPRRAAAGAGIALDAGGGFRCGGRDHTGVPAVAQRVGVIAAVGVAAGAGVCRMPLFCAGRRRDGACVLVDMLCGDREVDLAGLRRVVLKFRILCQHCDIVPARL